MPKYSRELQGDIGDFVITLRSRKEEHSLKGTHRH
jgi:hypothetical protein